MKPAANQANSPDATWLRSFRRKLLTWYKAHGRQLPWRETHDPYAVWVSEVMLQQTQVATVLGYYKRFLQRFPTVQALAAAEEQDVLQYWEGLGYYRRARQLHRAAGVIVSEHDGQFPDAFDAVLALPGIGRYTAGAILSFALGQRQPIVEANTARLYCRLLAHAEDPTTSSSQHRLWDFAEQLLPQKNVGELNQALIELGATVCVPRQPKCQECPAMALCPTFTAGLQEQIPVAKRKVQYEDRHEVAVVVSKGKQVLLRKCAEGGRWAGLWDFPRFTMTPKTASHELPALLANCLAEEHAIEVAIGEHLTTIRHGVTRYRITLDCYRAQWQRGRLSQQGEELVWSSVDQLNNYPLSVTGRKISELLK